MVRYLSQARELERLAGEEKVIKIETCDSTQTGELLRVLGYRMRGGCGSEVVLETVNAARAFLTIDSGFPLAELEQALRTNRPFSYDYHPTDNPVLYGRGLLAIGQGQTQPAISSITFLGDPSLCRLYLGLSKLDPDTADELRQAIPAPRLKVMRMCSTFSAGCSRFAMAKPWCRAARGRKKPGRELVGASARQRAGVFRKAPVAKMMAGWPAISTLLARDQRSGAGVSLRSRPPEALLRGHPRKRHQSWPGASRVSRQH